MRMSRFVAVAIVGALSVGACGSDDGPTVSLSSPASGAIVAGGVPLEMAAEGVTIEEAGTVRHGAGHFHVIADDGCVETGSPIAKDADHVHFGKGQSEGLIYLEPGPHELCLQVGDGVHAALDITDRRSIEVAIADQEEFCGVVIEIDQLFDALDNSSDEFALRQVGYENIRRLAMQLESALDVVDAADRDELAATVSFVSALSSAFVDAADEADAEQALVPVFESISQDLPGTEWILTNCGIDIADD